MASVLEANLVPTKGTVNHSLHDTNPLPPRTVGIVVNVTTAGILAVVFHGSTTEVQYDLAIGTHLLPGNFKLVKSTNTTAVVSGTRVVAEVYNPVDLKL